MGTTQRRSSCAAMEEPMMHAAVDVSERRLQPTDSHAGAAALGRGVFGGGRRAEGAATFGDLR